MILSPDDYLLDEDGRYMWTPERSRMAWGRIQQEVLDLLPRHSKLVLLAGLPGAGKTCWVHTPGNIEPGALYLDATFVKKVWRRPFLQLALRLGKPIEILCFKVPLSTLLERNSKRPTTRTPGPEVLIEWFETFNREFPSTSDGFNRVETIFP